MFDRIREPTRCRWFNGLKDRQAQARITAGISRLALGNAGDVKPVGSGVSEMRIDYGPGYRVYFEQGGPAIGCCCVQATRTRRTGYQEEVKTWQLQEAPDDAALLAKALGDIARTRAA